MSRDQSLENLDPAFVQWYKGIITASVIVVVAFLVRDIYIAVAGYRIILDLLSLGAASLSLYLGEVRKNHVAGVLVVAITGELFITIIVILEGGIASPTMLYYHVIALACGMLFRGYLQWIIGIGAFLCMLVTFCVEVGWPELLGNSHHSFSDYVITHLSVYFLVLYGTWLSKKYLDRQKDQQSEQNLKIAAQNKALSEQQDEIKKLNEDLQEKLDERTEQLAQALEDAHNREAYMRSLVESQTTFLFRIDMSGKILFVNKALSQLIQRRREEGSRENGFFYENLLAKDRLFLQEIVFEALNNPGSPVKATLPVRKELANQQESPRYIDWEFLAVKNMANGKMEIQAVGYDITNRLQVEKQIKEKSSELEILTENLIRRNNELTDFGYMVSHNLRGPVANIVGLTKFLEEDGQQAEVIKRLKLASEGLDGIIRDLNLIIDLKNTSKEDYELIRLEEVFQQVLLQLQDETQEKGAEVIPDFSADSELFLIRPYLFSILYNLISNGLKYSHPERQPRLWIQVKENPDSHTIFIRDNGAGIDMDKHGKRLFNLYERFSENKNGKGIGLHMVKVQVEAMQGQIEVESEPGIGSCFALTFPKSAS